MERSGFDNELAAIKAEHDAEIQELNDTIDKLKKALQEQENINIAQEDQFNDERSELKKQLEEHSNLIQIVTQKNVHILKLVHEFKESFNNLMALDLESELKTN